MRQNVELDDVYLLGGRVAWLETLRLPVSSPRGDALLAIHLELGHIDGPELSEVTSSLGNMRDVPGSRRNDVEALLNAQLPGVNLATGRTGYVVTHWVPDEMPASPIPGLAPEVGWARILAAANPAAMKAAALRKQDAEYEVELSASWVASVLNAGAAFVGRSGTGDAFHETAAVLVHSVYLDALLLALCQERGVDYLSRQVGDLWAEGKSLTAVKRLERDALRFRAQVWWTDISPILHANRILRRLQDERDLPRSEPRLRADVDDMVAYASARRADRTNALLSLFVIAGFGVGGAALIADPGLIAVVWGVVLSLTAWLIMVLAGHSWWAGQLEMEFCAKRSCGGGRLRLGANTGNRMIAGPRE